MLDRSIPEEVERAERAKEQLFRQTTSLDGTLSGEHGIGLVKRNWVAREVDATSLALMHAIKRQFDPALADYNKVIKLDPYDAIAYNNRGKAYADFGDYERAIEASGGKDLSIKVDYAKYYARTLYERELHDQLLEEVLAADPVQPGFTLFNTLAQNEALELLESADDYF